MRFNYNQLVSPMKVFYLAAREDVALLRELEQHLAELRRTGVIEDWHPERLTGGEDIVAETRRRMMDAHVFIPLLSAALFTEQEALLTEFLRRCGTVRLLPVLVRHCDYQATEWGRFQPLPRDGKPVAARRYRDKVWAEVALALRDRRSSSEAKSRFREPTARRSPWPAAGAATSVALVASALGVALWPWTPSDMVKLPGGAFTLVEPYKDARQVPPYALDRTEVTRADFLGWLQAREGVRFDGDLVKDRDGEVLLLLSAAGFPLEDRSRRPASGVTQSGAARYCQTLGKRLPLYEEWDLAARGAGKLRDYPWGDGPPNCSGVVFDRGRAQGSDPSICAMAGSGPAEVGTAAQDRSAQGVRDLAGNVSEWVQTSDGGSYARGGSWARSGAACKTDYFIRLEPGVGYRDLGFRCARELGLLGGWAR